MIDLVPPAGDGAAGAEGVVSFKPLTRLQCCVGESVSVL